MKAKTGLLIANVLMTISVILWLLFLAFDYPIWIPASGNIVQVLFLGFAVGLKLSNKIKY